MLEVGRWTLSAAGISQNRKASAESKGACGELNVQRSTLNAQLPTLIPFLASDFDLAATLECGQVFHWRREGAGYVGVIGDVPCYIEQQGNRLLVPHGLEDLVRHYFALNHPLAEICATFPNDPAMNAACEFCRGLRIVRQPTWECLATFITSALKQVVHIAQISHALRERFGERVEWNGRALFSYPKPERLAACSEADLRACALGFRAKNLLGAARMIAGGEVDLAAIAALDDTAARRELCRLPGVGEKVANCTLLFGFERLRAFPVDVWIERVLRQLYFVRKRRVTPRRLREFSASYFGEYGGYAQQYLFHHARLTWRRGGSNKVATSSPHRRSLKSPSDFADYFDVSPL